MRTGLTMDFNALDLLASAAALQTRDSENSGDIDTNSGTGVGEENSEQGAENDDDADADADPDDTVNVKTIVTNTEDTMGSMKKEKHSHVSRANKHPMENGIEELGSNKLNGKTLSTVDDVIYLQLNNKLSMNQTDNSDTDSCTEEDNLQNTKCDKSSLDQTDVISSVLMTDDDIDASGKNKTIMRSLLTGETVCDENEGNVPQCTSNLLEGSKNVNCDEEAENMEIISVLGNNPNSIDNSAIENIPLDKTDFPEKNVCETKEDSIPDAEEKNCDANMNDSVLDSSQSASDGSPSLGHSEALNFLVVSDHCYASVPGQTNSRCSFLEGDDPESDSGIDGNSSSEEPEHRTRSISIDSNCLQCRFPEISGRSGQLLSQGSSDVDQSPIENSSFALGLSGLSVLSPTLSSSDSQCSDYHHTGGVSLVENDSICDGNKKYKTVDFDLDSSTSNTSTSDNKSESNPPEPTLTKVGKFKIGKFASFTNIDSDSDKIYGRDSFSSDYVISPQSTGLPASPGIPSLLQSPCGDWDRSDAGSEVLDDMESVLPPTLEESGKELLMVLTGVTSPQGMILAPAYMSTVVHHDHDYCFRSGSLPTSPICTTKKAKGEKRKYMTAARSRGTTAYVKEKKTKTIKIKNNKKGQLSETIEKVKNSLASTPVSIDCDFKKPEQPANSMILDKINPLNRSRRLKSLDIKEEDPEIELDSGSKLKITGKFQNDFVYFLNKTSRNRRRASVETALMSSELKKMIQPAKPIDIIVPHLTDDDLEVVQAKGRAGLAKLEKFSSNPHLLDRFSAALHSQNKLLGVDQGLRIKTEKVSEPMDDDKIINTILSMENDNLGSPVPVDSVDNEMDFFGEGETINIMGQNMTLTRDEVDLLLNAVKNVSSQEEFIGGGGGDSKMEYQDCDHSSTCSTDIQETTTDIDHPEWTDQNTKPDDDAESSYSSSDVGPSSCVSDIKEDSQESIELKSDLGLQPVQSIDTNSDESNQQVEAGDDSMKHHVDSDIVMRSQSADVDITKADEDVKMPNMNTELMDMSEIKNELVVPKSPSHEMDSKSLETALVVDKPILDNDLDVNLDIDTKPDKSLLDSELNNFSNALAPTLSDLNLPLEKPFELLASDFRLDKADELFPEANVEPPPPMEQPTSDYNDTPWVVTVTVFWNDLPAIMINNRAYIRLVDIHKQILPAKDTGILKKRCQLLSIHVLNCTEMQRYFLVQYGRGYNSKSTLIVSKHDACQLVGYYAQPQPRIPRSDDNVLRNLSRLSQHMAYIRGKQSRLAKRKKSGSRAASRNTSPDRKEGVTHSAPPSPKVRKQPPPPPLVQPELTKRLRHKKINFLEMLKGDTNDRGESEASVEKKVTSARKKADALKKAANIAASKKKEIEIELNSDLTSEDEDEEESDDASDEDEEKYCQDTEEEEEQSESSSDEQNESDELEIKMDNKVKNKKIVKNVKQSVNTKTSSVNVKKSPVTKSPNGKRSLLKKFCPLRVNVKGLIHLPNPMKKSAINKTESKGLDVVHTPIELKAGVLSISQNGILFMDLYKKKSSLCVRCADCEKLLSIASFLQHQHYPEESKTLTTVLQTQTLSLKSSESSRSLKSKWEEFQRRHEKFEGDRFPKPVVRALETQVKKDPPVICEDIVPSVCEDNVPSDCGDNVSSNCEDTEIGKISENSVGLPSQAEGLVVNTETGIENLPLTVCADEENNDTCATTSNNLSSNTLPSDNTPFSQNGSQNDATVNDAMTVNTENQIDLDSTQDSVTSKQITLDRETLNNISESTVSKTVSKTKSLDVKSAGLDIKSNVRSSSRKRKSKQYFNFEDYSFSSKKSKMDEENK